MKLAAENLDDAFLTRCIDKLSAFMAQEGRTYQNHLAAILNWAKTAVMEEDKRTGASKPATPQNTPQYKAVEERKLTEAEQAVIDEWNAFNAQHRESAEKYAKVKELAERNGGLAPEILKRFGMILWNNKWIFN